MSDARLETLFKGKDAAECVRFCLDADEKLKKQLKAFAKKVCRDFERYELWRMASLALFSLSTLSELKKLGRNGIPDGPDALQAVELLQPGWINEWAEWALELEPGNFRVVRPLIERGLCMKPQTDAYVLGLIDGYARSMHVRTKLLDKLLSTDDFLEEDVWRLFEVEGAGEYSLAAQDKYAKPGYCWADALCVLSARGKLDRRRLLEASLDALERDFGQFRAGWFSRFHEQLEPTPEEREALKERYLRLLGSAVPPTVAFALKALGGIDKLNPLTADELTRHVEPALLTRSKSSAMNALKLLEKIARRDKGALAAVSRLAAGALIHEHADVQKKALDLLDRFGDETDAQLREAIALNAEALAPSLKKNLGKWSDDVGVIAVASSEPATGAARHREVLPVEPIETHEELVERFGFVLENPGEAIEIERVLDGAARLGGRPPDDWQKLSSPLSKRATALLRRNPEDPVVLDLAQLALSMATRAKFSPPPLEPLSKRYFKYHTFRDTFRLRIEETAAQMEQGGSPGALSLPSDTMGFIEPAALVRRALDWEKSGREPGLIDRVLSLLRLNPAGRENALKEAAVLRSEFGAALRFALGNRERVGRAAALWIAAARARSPLNDCPEVERRHRRLGPDAGMAAQYSFALKMKRFGDNQEYVHHWLELKREPAPPSPIPPVHAAVLFHGGSGGMFDPPVCGSTDSLVRWCATIQPGNLEPYFSAGAARIDLEWDAAQWEVVHYFDPLFFKSVRPGEMAVLLIAQGLGAKETGQKAIATEAFITCIEDGRLTAEALARPLGRMLTSGYLKCKRLAATLGDAARVGPRHAGAVRDVIRRCLSGDPHEPPRDLGALLELLFESCVEAGEGLNHPGARSYLEKLEAGGKTGSYAKKLLKLN